MKEENEYQEKARRYSEMLKEGWKAMTDDERDSVINAFHDLACDLLKEQEAD